MADINKKDRDGQTALMHASKNGYLDIVQLLLANEADVNTENNNGKTALFYATWKKHNNVAKALLEKDGVRSFNIIIRYKHITK
jgi:ankyrin repeat protein